MLTCEANRAQGAKISEALFWDHYNRKCFQLILYCSLITLAMELLMGDLDSNNFGMIWIRVDVSNDFGDDTITSEQT